MVMMTATMTVALIMTTQHQEDDQLRRKAEGGGSSAATGLQELLPFAGGAASAQSLRRLAEHDRERQEMLKVCLLRVWADTGWCCLGAGCWVRWWMVKVWWW